MPKKILVIEDERHIRHLLVQTLEMAFEDYIDDEELEILECENGQLGADTARAENPDLVFSDVMMPEKDGFQVCREIREDSALSESTYVILLTAKGQEVDRQKGLEVGADEYMTKPFNPDQVTAKVEEVLGLERCD